MGWAGDQMIRQGGHPNVVVLADRLEVHRRTILRDVEFLRNSWGAPLEYSRQHKGYFYTNPDFALPCLRLTEGELVAFFLAERLMQLGGAPTAGLIVRAGLDFHATS